MTEADKSDSIKVDFELLLDLSEKEANLIEYIRGMGYGRLVVHIEDSRPVRIEQVLKSVKL